MQAPNSAISFGDHNSTEESTESQKLVLMSVENEVKTVWQKRILLVIDPSQSFTYRKDGPFAKDLPSNLATKVSSASYREAV